MDGAILKNWPKKNPWGEVSPTVGLNKQLSSQWKIRWVKGSE